MQDLFNAVFELGGCLLVLLSIRQTLRDKQVRGVHWGTVLFFACWGYWNLYYYPHLGQWLSLAGGIGVTVANSTWVGLLIYYSRKEKRGNPRH